MGLRKILDSLFSTGKEERRITLGRNEPCWCGSGTKYKKCHLEEDQKKGLKQNSLNCGST